MIHELLQKLPRCGQNAFDSFLGALRVKAVSLAKKLQRIYKEKQAESQTSKS